MKYKKPRLHKPLAVHGKNCKSGSGIVGKNCKTGFSPNSGGGPGHGYDTGKGNKNYYGDEI